MLGLLKRLIASESGNFAVITALAVIPVAGMTGLAVDYSQAYSVRSTLQGEADAIALAVAAEGPTVAKSRFYDPMVMAAKDRITLGDTTFNGRWISVNDYEVVGRTRVPRSLSRLIPVGGETIEVSSRTVARYMGARLEYKSPERSILDPEAGDYNRIYAYCFDSELGKLDPSVGRSQRTAIADNGGTVYSDPIPRCAPGETLSFELFNVRNARGNKNQWDNKKAEHYSYHTDTKRSAEGRESYDLGGWAILETVICPTLERCRNKSAKGNGVLPHGKNRIPERATGTCDPGKFMYFGWEDRPPGRGDSDRDYDDIRVIIECPVVKKVGDENVRLMH